MRRPDPCPNADDLLRTLRAQAHGRADRNAHEIFAHLEDCARCRRAVDVLGCTDPILNEHLGSAYQRLKELVDQKISDSASALVSRQSDGEDSAVMGRPAKSEPEELTLRFVLRKCEELADARTESYRVQLEAVRRIAAAWVAENRDTVEHDTAQRIYNLALARANEFSIEIPIDVSAEAPETLVALFYIQFSMPALGQSQCPALYVEDNRLKFRIWVTPEQSSVMRRRNSI